MTSTLKSSILHWAHTHTHTHAALDVNKCFKCDDEEKHLHSLARVKASVLENVEGSVMSMNVELQ